MKAILTTAKVNAAKKIGPHEFFVGEKRPPHGIGFMKAVLEAAGHDVDVVDPYCGDDSRDGSDFSDCDLLGIYCSTICMDDVREMILRSRAPRIAVGGPHWSIFPDDGAGERWLEKVTYVVRGEGEPVIVDLLEGNIPPGDVRVTRLSDWELDRLPRFPFEYFWLVGQKRYQWGFPYANTTPVFTMNTSRGCPFSCRFCSTKKVWGRTVTFMSAERIFRDIEYVVRRFGAKGVYFREDNFTVRKERVWNLCNLLLKSNLRVDWACETRVDTVDRPTMELMRRAGWMGAYVGVEHGSQKILDELGKGITVDQTIRFFDVARSLGVRTAASLIVKHPKETPDDVAKFWALVNRIKPNMIWCNNFRAEG